MLKIYGVNIFVFADELREMKIKEHDVLVSYDVSSLFTNVPVDETIESIAEPESL